MSPESWEVILGKSDQGSPPNYADPATQRKIDQNVSAWQQLADGTWRLHSQWTLETVKHLAAVNIAGIAGCAAILAGTSQVNGSQLKWALIVFTGGLLMALLDFWLNSFGYWRRGRDASDRLFSARRARSYEDLAEANRDYEDPGKWFFSAAGVIGWISAISAMTGGALLGYSLLSQ